MLVSKSVWFLGVLSVSFLCFISWKHSIVGVRDALILAGRAVLLLGLSTWMVSLYPRLRSAFSSKPPPSEYAEDEETERRRKLAREEQQERLKEKALTYQESVLKPRQEASLSRKQERFYRMTGEIWKLTVGEQLGEVESPGPSAQEEVSGTPNQEAVRRRKLPESATRVHPKPDPKPEKKIIVLPEEPADDAEGVVRVALRCPSGRTVHRRFLKSHSSLILLDWLLKIGYHPTIYTLCTTYPRRPLITGKDLSMEEAGILTHTVLNIEEKDPSGT